MYQEVGIAKLSPAQLSRLRNGHKVRIKIGNSHKINLSKEQYKKLNSAHKKGKAYTVLFDPYQIEKHGTGVFGDIARGAKAFIKKHNLQNIVNPIIHGAKTAGHRGISKLSKIAHSSLDKITPIEGEGVIGDILGMINPTMGGIAKTVGLGVARKHSSTSTRTRTRRPKRQGKGILGDLVKSGVKAVAKKGIEAGSNYLNEKIDGLGVVKSKLMRKKTASKTKSGRGCCGKGGALYPAGMGLQRRVGKGRTSEEVLANDPILQKIVRGY